MFTPKAAVYFSSTIGLLALALLLGDFEIGVLVLGLASLFFFSNIWGLPERADVSLDRRIVPDETFGGEDVRVESIIRNLTNVNLANIEIHESLGSTINPVKGTNRTPATLRSREELRLIVEFPSPKRAIYEIGPLIVRARDPFGFYLTEKRLGPGTLSVMPRPERLKTIRFRPRHVGPWPGAIPSKFLGLGTEFYSMRQYVSGDDPKRINWKASARHRELIVNETEAEKVTDIMVLLDTYVTVYRTIGNQLFEHGVQAAASITSLLLRQGNRVGLVLQGGERGSVPSGFGRRHERRILYMLAAARPGRASVSTSYVMTLLARRMLPSRAQVILISPLLDPEIKEGVRELTLTGYSMLVLSPSLAIPSTIQDETEKTAFKLVMLERHISLLALERSATVIDWPIGISLSEVVSKVNMTRPIAAA